MWRRPAAEQHRAVALHPGVSLKGSIERARNADPHARLVATARQQHLSRERLHEARSGARDHATHPLDDPGDPGR